MSEFSEKDTDWNFAVAYLKRIDIALQKCNYFKGIRDYDNWLLNIDIVHTEIYPRLEIEKKRDGTLICDEYTESDHLKQIAKVNVSSWKRKGNIDSWIIHDSLSNYERFLRNVMRKRGMDMPKKQDPGHALLN